MKTETKNGKSLFAKGLVVVVTACLMMIPVLMVMLVVDERENLSEKVQREIADSWGPAAVIHAPALKVPLKKDKDSYYDDFSVREPDSVAIEGNVSVEILHRSIYDVPVYRTSLTVSGTVTPDARLISDARRQKECYLYFGLSSLKGIEGDFTVDINGKKQRFSSYRSELRLPVTTESLQAGIPIDYSFTFNLKGSKSLKFSPDASIYRLSLTSDWASPGFNGAYLPSERTISASGFEAKWNITSFNSFDGTSDAGIFGVDFVTPVSQYQQTMRSMKYSFLVVFLIFMGIFLVERISRKNVSIIQYIVTGLSLSLFYLLLISFSEYIAFGWAYLAASVLTTAALGTYFRAILRSRIAYAFTGAVATFYAIVYMLLQLETGSLLIGSIILFIILCVIMYVTRNLNRSQEDGLPPQENDQCPQ